MGTQTENNFSSCNLSDVVKIHTALAKYEDNMYTSMMRNANAQAKEILHGEENTGRVFVQNCARDLAGEVVRNFFDTSDYYITVDQLAERIIKFEYENEYDPLLKEHNNIKNILNYNDFQSSTLENITAEMDSQQQKIFVKTDGKYDDEYLMTKSKREYAQMHKNDDGSITDEYSGKDGEYVTDKNGNHRSREQVDHVQSAAAATYNKRYITDKGIDDIKRVLNSSENFAMMDSTANQSKGDVRVCEVDGKVEYLNSKEIESRQKSESSVTDITHRATPEQLAEAVCEQWEKNPNSPKSQTLKDKGYLNEDGKVPDSVKNKLIENARQSQNAESKVILKNTNYAHVTADALRQTKNSVGKIIAGQLIYYSAPPIVFEIRKLLKDKKADIDITIGRLKESLDRVGEYVSSKLKNIIQNVVFNSIKKFVKTFMDILINLVKATVKKLMKIAKNLVMATVDAVRVAADKTKSKAERADAVFKLFGVTVTNVVIELLFELIEKSLKIPEWLLKPLQVLTSVICTNLVMLILQKVDLFDVRFGFKINSVNQLFERTREEYARECEAASEHAESTANLVIDLAKSDSIKIYQNLSIIDPKMQSVESSLDRINQIFNMGIDFNSEWLQFLGLAS